MTDLTTTVHDHPFTPPTDRPWALCVMCRLGQAAHDDPGEPYVPEAPKAKPEVSA